MEMTAMDTGNLGHVRPHGYDKGRAATLTNQTAWIDRRGQRLPDTGAADAAADATRLPDRMAANDLGAKPISAPENPGAAATASPTTAGIGVGEIGSSRGAPIGHGILPRWGPCVSDRRSGSPGVYPRFPSRRQRQSCKPDRVALVGSRIPSMPGGFLNEPPSRLNDFATMPNSLFFLFLAVSGLSGLTPAAEVVAGTLPTTTVLREWSGLVACRTRPGYWWAQNDSGNPAELILLDPDLRVAGEYPIAATNTDWEDLAWADGRIFIADTGDNQRRRDHVKVIMIAEPDAHQPPSGPLHPERNFTLRFPDGPRDVEALVVSQTALWLLDKRVGGTTIWQADRNGQDEQLLREVHLTGLVGPILAADLTANGDTLAVAHPVGVHFYPVQAGDLTTLIPSQATVVLLPLAPQREALAFSLDGSAILCGSESGVWWRLQLAPHP